MLFDIVDDISDVETIATGKACERGAE